MSTLGASQTAPRVSARQIAAIGVILLTLAAVLGVIGPVLPASATQPYVVADVVCSNGVVTINWTAHSWLQTGGPGSGNPNIVIRFDSVPVASGAFTAANGYQFSGSNPWPDLSDTEVFVLAIAIAPFDNGAGQGTSARWTVNLPPNCNTTTTQGTTTTTQGTTTTTQGTTTTTEGPTTTTTQGTTTTQPPTLVTDPQTGVLGIQVSAPAQVNQVTQETLPFTGISTGSLALLAAAFAGVGLLLLLAARQKDEKSPVRSWN